MIAVLFARRDSVYKQFGQCDVFDADRDARTYEGGRSVVAHPPCRSWGALRCLAKPEPGERENARWAVGQVQKWGGVLEHPARSTLWPDMDLPVPGQRDGYGFTLPVDQWWWGHKAKKSTWLYICGVEMCDLPPIPYAMGEAEFVVNSSRGTRGRRPEITKAEREHTPIELARWLVQVAEMAS